MSLFSYEVNDRVAEILFNNPPVNALTQALLGDFLEALERASHDPEVRAVIIGSQVPGRFSAGLDLTAVHTGAHQKVRALLDLLYVRMTEVQFRMGKPTIAAVGGTARGGGMTIAISCDMVVASSDATFGYPEIDAGVLPSIHFTHLPRIVGRHRAFELLFTGRAFDAQEALRIGFVHEVVAADQLDAKVDELVKALASASPNAVRACKKLVLDVAEREINAALIAATVEGIADIRASDEGREGVQSFLQKRKPSWLA